MAYPKAQTGESAYFLETLNKLAEDDFFSVLEITWIKDRALRKSVREVAENSHVALTYAAQPALLNQKLDLSSPVESERRRAVDQIRTCVDEAVELGAERMSLLSGFDRGEADRKEAMRLMVESTREICAYGEQQHMPITLEPFDREVEKKCVIGPAEDAATLTRTIRKDYRNFGIMYDMAHGPLLNEDPRHALTVLKDCLVHIHLGNCVKKATSHPAYGDKHPRFGVEGGEHDVVELTKFMKILFDIDYLSLKRKPDGRLPIVGFEVKPMPNESPEGVIAGSKRVWKQAWARL
jgi:sugar phosphate isomerase/epimerase